MAISPRYWLLPGAVVFVIGLALAVTAHIASVPPMIWAPN